MHNGGNPDRGDADPSVLDHTGERYVKEEERQIRNAFRDSPRFFTQPGRIYKSSLYWLSDPVYKEEESRRTRGPVPVLGGLRRGVAFVDRIVF